MVADSIQAVGGVEWDPAAVTLTYPPPRDGAPTVADPYADVEVIPNPLPSCLHSDYSTTNPDTLSPGRYCDDLKINSGDVVTFNPGVYLITEGDFDVNAGAVLNGTDVTIIMTADDPGDTGSFRINGSATVNLTSPGPAGHNYWPYSGDYAGILVYVDRNSDPNVNHFFNGGSNMLMQGAIYAPVDVINFGGGADITTGCLQVIGSQVHFSGTSNVTATRDDCGDLGARTLGSDLSRIVE